MAQNAVLSRKRPSTWRSVSRPSGSGFKALTSASSLRADVSGDDRLAYTEQTNQQKNENKIVQLKDKRKKGGGEGVGGWVVYSAFDRRHTCKKATPTEA